MAFGQALALVGVGLTRHPLDALIAGTRYATDLVAAGAAVGARLLGADVAGPIAPPARDRRFSDPAWQQNPAYFGLQQSYLLSARFARELVDVADLNEPQASKAQFAAQLVADALAPSNYLWGNPTALKRAFETGGTSLVRGFRNFLQDLATNSGMCLVRLISRRSPSVRTWPARPARSSSETS